MDILHLTQRIRPLKFVFLVTESDEEQILFSFKLNSCLWGGILNPVVSVEQGSDFVDSIFEASRADIGINLTNIPWPRELVQKYGSRLKDFKGFDGLVLDDENGDHFRMGCDMIPMYRDYWNRHGKYRSLTKDPEDNKYIFLKGQNDRWNKYATIVSGTFPDGFNVNYEHHYSNSTKCKVLTIDQNKLDAFRTLDVNTPLNFTLYNLRCHYPTRWGPLDGYTIFVGELGNVGDWLEFWNLRSCRFNVLFVPWDLVENLKTHIREYIQEGHYPIRNEIENRVTIQKSSTLSEEHFENALGAIRERNIEKKTLVVSLHMPKFGLDVRDVSGSSYGPSPLESLLCLAYEQEDLIPLSENKIEFKLAIPEYLNSYKTDSNRGWAISFTGWEPDGKDIWLKMPVFASVEEMLRDNYHLLFSDYKLCKRESLVIFRNDRTFSESISFTLPNTLQVFKAVFAEFGLTLKDYSEKGKHAAGIENAMGGYWGGAMLLRDRGVRKLLQRLSEKGGTRHLPKSELVKIVGEESQLVRRASKEKINAIAIVDSLIRKKVLRPGLEFKCSQCYRRGWYDLSQCGSSFTCQFCYEEQPLPVLDGLDWRYRSSGLFGTHNVGYGSLAVICTYQLFRKKFFHREAKHIYSFEYINKDGNPREIDLAFIRLGFDGSFDVVFCECKSAEFSKDDFDKLREIAIDIPGSVVCVSTLKHGFSDEEICWANELWEDDCKVIMLSASEIESDGLVIVDVEEKYRHFNDFSGFALATYKKYIEGQLTPR